MTTISQTIGHDQVVDEMVISFTHTMVVDWMLPGLAPTGKRVEAAVVVIVKFDGDKIAHEHIYWDQASVLVQLGCSSQRACPSAAPRARAKCSIPACRSARGSVACTESEPPTGRSAALRALQARR